VWQPEYHDLDMAERGFPGVVVTGVVNLPAPIVRETLGAMRDVARCANAAGLDAVLPGYYRLLAMWFASVKDGETEYPLGTPEAVAAFEEEQDWAVLGMAFNDLLVERNRRRSEAKNVSSGS